MEERAKLLDEADDLSTLRDQFHIPLAKNTNPTTVITDDRECIYLNGNSLGVMVRFRTIC